MYNACEYESVGLQALQLMALQKGRYVLKGGTSMHTDNKKAPMGKGNSEMSSEGYTKTTEGKGYSTTA